VADTFFEPIDADSLRRTLGFDPAARWIQSGADVAGAMVWPEGRPGALYVPEFASLHPGLLDLAGLPTEPIFRSETSPSFAVYDANPPPLPDQPIDDLSFGTGDGPALIALDGLSQPAAGLERLEFGGWWRVLASLPDDLAMFAHLTDASGALAAQHDGLDAAAPTLRPGDVILQRHALPLPPDLPPGEYTLQLGLYRRGDGRRLLLVDGKDAVAVASCAKRAGERAALQCRLTDFR
jgi:hypothetical protein